MSSPTVADPLSGLVHVFHLSLSDAVSGTFMEWTSDQFSRRILRIGRDWHLSAGAGNRAAVNVLPRARAAVGFPERQTSIQLRHCELTGLQNIATLCTERTVIDYQLALA